MTILWEHKGLLQFETGRCAESVVGRHRGHAQANNFDGSMTVQNANEPGTPSVPDVRIRLHDAARLLRDSQSIDPEVRRVLADLVDELGQAFETPGVPPAEVAHLAEVTAHLTEALHQGHDRGQLEQLRNRMKELVLQAETRAPTAFHLVESLINALANIGI